MPTPSLSSNIVFVFLWIYWKEYKDSNKSINKRIKRMKLILIIKFYI
jgi:hypothetical protein